MNQFIDFTNNAITGFWQNIFVNTTFTVGNNTVNLGQIIFAGIVLSAVITMVGVVLNKG